MKDFPVLEEKNAKNRLKSLTESKGYPYDALIDHLCFCFGENMGENYQYILGILNSIIETKD